MPSTGTVKSMTVVGLPVREGAEEQALLLHGQKVLAVDPDQVDRAARMPGCGFFRHDSRNGFGRERDLHVSEIDAV
jgi:hypothetical protein